MEIIIEWSELAEYQIRDIFDYYQSVANKRIAKKLITKLLLKVDLLYLNPKLGTKEELLIDYIDEYRFLIEGNYKIVYWIGGNKITIAAVFDCRQNPTKIKNIVSN